MATNWRAAASGCVRSNAIVAVAMTEVMATATGHRIFGGKRPGYHVVPVWYPGVPARCGGDVGPIQVVGPTSLALLPTPPTRLAVRAP